MNNSGCFFSNGCASELNNGQFSEEWQATSAGEGVLTVVAGKICSSNHGRNWKRATAKGISNTMSLAGDLWLLWTYRQTCEIGS